MLCFPATQGVDLVAWNMNYTCLIYGGTMLFALCWYAVDARKWFTGPKVNTEHMIHTDLLEGQRETPRAHIDIRPTDEK